MCWKYINPYGTVFVKCDVYNTQPWAPSYLCTFTDKYEGYYEDLNYCSYCGKKLEIKDSKGNVL